MKLASGFLPFFIRSTFSCLSSRQIPQFNRACFAGFAVAVLGVELLIPSPWVEEVPSIRWRIETGVFGVNSAS